MTPRIKILGRACVLLMVLMSCQVSVVFARATTTEVMESIQRGDYQQLSPETQAAIATAQESARVAADMDRTPQSVIQFSLQQAAQMEQQARAAYVAALPPRDQALGAQVMLGAGQLTGGQGKLYYFVSRAMPLPLLRAYALDALYTGGTLVLKGLRKGDTINEYMTEAIADFNSAEGQLLSSMEINPNLFDMFNITVVPTVVWTNRANLDDAGSGCENLPEGVPAPKVSLPGPEDTLIVADAPVCAPVPAAHYYKMAGALATNYVLDKFQDAGAPQIAMDVYRNALSDRHRNVNDGTLSAAIGNGLTPIPHEIRLDTLPRSMLEHWRDELSQKSVQKGPYGPVFDGDVVDDPAYRQELTDKIEHGLGL